MRLAPHTLPRLAALAAFLGCAALVGLAQQPPVEEEVPNSKGSVKKRIVVEDDDTVAKKGAPAGNPPDVRLDELVRASDEARSAALKATIAKYIVPFDRVNEGGNWVRVQPIPLRQAEWPKGVEAINVTPLDGAGKAREARGVAVAGVRGVEHFESAALAEAESLLKQKAEPPVTEAEHLGAIEKLLSAALRFHDYARERQLRRGKTWDDVRDPLAAKLCDVRLEQLRSAIAANDSLRVREAGTRLMNAYPKDAAVAAEVAAARVADAQRLLASAAHIDHVRARELIDEFEARFPGAGGEAVKKIRQQLRELASKAFTRAQEKKAVGDLTTARDELARASALDPTLDGVRDLQRELRSGYPILYVAVRQWPEKMSPATAKLDGERQVVELVFEGLLEEVPGKDGAVRYRAGAALALPNPAPGGREFLLRSFDRDPVGRPGFDSHDVVGTLKLLNNMADTWPAYQLPWIGGLPTPRDANVVRVPFALGHPDPRAALTFKILPARWMNENAKGATDAGFAEKPFGTGPFKFHSVATPAGGGPREMVFIDNPLYGRWRDRNGLPQLREVRLVEAARIDDPVKAFAAGRLHVLPDVQGYDVEKFTGPGSGLAGRVQAVKHTTNRRVHILAMNLRYLRDKSLRQGISMAIDRQQILRDVFKSPGDTPRPMTGPYPPGSWAAPKVLGEPPQLFNRDLAAARLKTYLSGTGRVVKFTLKYAEDDPRAEDVCRKIKAQIEMLTKDEPEERRLSISLHGVPLRELITNVEGEHRFELAYIPFDYPDDWHPFGLGAALDPAATGLGGRNWFSFLAKDTNPDGDDLRLGQVLNELRGYRDVGGQLAPRAAEAARLFNDCVPFAPLWQLDRYTVVSNSLRVFVDDSSEQARPEVLNPTVLFQGVARWRLD